MIKKTIEISRQAVHLSAKIDQLIVQPFDEDKSAQRSIACEDIGVLLIDQPRCSITQGALEAVLRHGGVVVICGRDHLPAGLLLPTCANTEQVLRLREQTAVSKPRHKRLWQQIVQAKITNQQLSMPDGHPGRKKLTLLAREVRSGDPTNVEAQAARIYWDAWRQADPALPGFRRDPDGQDPANIMLNYGYAVLRAALARAIVSAGLHPALGIHHHNPSNAFCLADDLVEPLRPAIDRRVRRIRIDALDTLDQQTKSRLLPVLTDPVEMESQSGPMMVALPRTLASLVACYRGESDQLLLPALPEADV